MLSKSFYCILTFLLLPYLIYANNNSILLVLDMQQSLLTPAVFRYHISTDQIDSLIINVNDAVKQAADNKIDVIYVRHLCKNWFINLLTRNLCNENNPESRIDNRIVRINDKEYAKSEGSALSNPELFKLLKEKQIKNIYISGIVADACVYKTAIDCQNNGFRVIMLEKAIAGSNKKKTAQSMNKYKKEKLEIAEKIIID